MTNVFLLLNKLNEFLEAAPMPDSIEMTTLRRWRAMQVILLLLTSTRLPYKAASTN